jgi:glycosyltransferase involved in cell wall biosynthesis
MGAADGPTVVHVMGWHSQQYGSFERFLVALAGRCRSSGVATHLVFRARPASEAFVADVAADVHVLAGPGVAGAPAYAARIGRLLGETRATHLHAHFGADAYLALAAAGRAGVGRRFATKHIVPAAGRLSAVRHRWLARRVERLWAVSEEVAERLRALGADPPGLEVCHLGVDADVYRPDPAARVEARAELGLGAGERLVLCTSHLRPGKGVEVLPRLAAELAGDPGGVVVAVAGDGPLRGALEAGGASATGRLRLLGVREDVPRLLAAADLFVFPTAGSEGLGLGALEAAAAAVPVAGSAVSDLPAILGDTAELVVPGDEDALLAACRALLADPIAAAARAHRGRERVVERAAVASAAERHAAAYLAPAPVLEPAAAPSQTDSGR